MQVICIGYLKLVSVLSPELVVDRDAQVFHLSPVVVIKIQSHLHQAVSRVDGVLSVSAQLAEVIFSWAHIGAVWQIHHWDTQSHQFGIYWDVLGLYRNGSDSQRRRGHDNTTAVLLDFAV